MNTKVCTKCKEAKPLKSYHKNVITGRGTRCKPCIVESRKIKLKKNPDQVENVRLLKAYGITLNTYRNMLKEQDGLCSICGTEADKVLNKKLYVDHDHDTSVVRGLLCSNCNTGIGLLKDSSECVTKAAEYLIKHGK